MLQEYFLLAAFHKTFETVFYQHIHDRNKIHVVYFRKNDVRFLSFLYVFFHIKQLTVLSTIVAGTTYKVTITRAGSVVTITYANPDGSKYAEYVGTNTTTPETLKVHVMAQVGTYDVTESTAKPSNEQNADTQKPAEQGTTAAPATPAGSKDNDTNPETGDTSAVAVVAIVALGAAEGASVSFSVEPEP